MKRALITGITGQDGSFLAELLLEKGYRVFGFARRASWRKPNCASHLEGRIEVLFGDMAEGVDIAGAVQESEPDEIYNLASQSRPGESWARAPETLVVNGLGAIRLFEAVRHHRPQCRVYHASSSEMFGQARVTPQNEQTPFNPVNPYAAAKIYAHHMALIYRGSYRLYISNGVLFNHESERRPLHFVTQKVAYGAACAALGIDDSPDLNEMGRPIVQGGKLALGDLGIARDWGYSGDFVRAMWLILQRDAPDDFVIGTGKLHTLRDLCEVAYRCAGRDWRDCVVSDPGLVRPLESGQTLADPSKARKELGWEPTVSFEEPEYTADSDGLGALRMLEAMRILGLEKKTRFYQASTSELYGLVRETPQKETTPFYPRSPYAVAKLYAYWITVNYREAYGMYACNGILFNHESPVRGETFVTRKITRALARIKLGLQDTLFLGNLNARRDWGHAKDYVEMQWLMLQQKEPEDFVIATGEQHSVRDFVNLAAKEAGIAIKWKGKGKAEKGYDRKGRCIVAVDPRYFRPTEVESLLGDPSKAKRKLGWVPKIRFPELVAEMMREDLKAAERDELVKKHGFAAYDFHE